jgi:hypothetical protein
MLAARKLILATALLHDRGYGALRLKAGMSPSGGHWRYSLKSKTGAIGPGGSLTGQKAFDWGDTEQTTPEELATLIEEKYPELMEGSRGEDPAYAAWLKEIIAESEPEGLFIEFWDSWEKIDHVALINCASKRKFAQAPQ